MLVSDLYCPSCRNAKDHKPQDNEVCWSCVAMGGAGNYKESKTHGDQLRAMTGEELAEWIDDVCKSAYDEGYTKETGEPLMSPYPSTAIEWVTWLKQEAQDG